MGPRMREDTERGVWMGTGGSRTAPTGWVVKSASTVGEGRFEGRAYGVRRREGNKILRLRSG